MTCSRPSASAVIAAILLVAASGCDGSLAGGDASVSDGGGDAGMDAATADGGGMGDASTDTDVPLDAPADGGLDAGEAGDCLDLGAWESSEPFADTDHVSHPLPSFAQGGYYWVHTMTSGGDERRLYSAAIAADGSLGPWRVASDDHGGGPHGFTAVVAGGEAYHFRNGHIARYPLTGDGLMSGDVELLEDGTDVAFGGNRYVWDSAVAATGSIVHLGGFSFDGYAYRHDVYRSDVPPSSRFDDTGMDHPGGRPGKSAFVASSGAGGGWVFTAENGGSRLWRASLDGSGTLGGLTEIGTLPAGDDNGRGDLLAVGDDLVAVRGAKVYAAHVAVDGSLGAFEPMPDLPAPQIDVHWGDGHLAGAAWGLAAGHVYLTGPKRVFYAAIDARPCP